MEEEAKYFQRTRNNAYNNRAPFPAQDQRPEPYRPPGYQEPPRPTPMEELIKLVVNMGKTIESNQRETTEGMQELQRQIRGVNAHLNDFEAWKKGVDTQLATLAQQVPRPQGQLPAHPDENPRGHIAAINLRSGRNLQDPREATPSTRQQEQREALPKLVPELNPRHRGPMNERSKERTIQ